MTLLRRRATAAQRAGQAHARTGLKGESDCESQHQHPATQAGMHGGGGEEPVVWHGARVNGGSNHDPLNIGCGTLIAPTTKILTARPV